MQTNISIQTFYDYYEANYIMYILLMCFQLDIWMGVTDVFAPVDVRVPSHNLQSFKSYLESLNIKYSTMIENLQVN